MEGFWAVSERLSVRVNPYLGHTLSLYPSFLLKVMQGDWAIELVFAGAFDRD